MTWLSLNNNAYLKKTWFPFSQRSCSKRAILLLCTLSHNINYFLLFWLLIACFSPFFSFSFFWGGGGGGVGFFVPPPVPVGRCISRNPQSARVWEHMGCGIPRPHWPCVPAPQEGPGEPCALREGCGTAGSPAVTTRSDCHNSLQQIKASAFDWHVEKTGWHQPTHLGRPKPAPSPVISFVWLMNGVSN